MLIIDCYRFRDSSPSLGMTIQVTASNKQPHFGDWMKKATGKQSIFALCLNNEGYKASLEVGKLYRVIPDVDAEKHGYLKIVDESGENYAFANDRFHLVTLPRPVEQTLLAAARV